MNPFSKSLLACALALPALASATSNLVINGSFEDYRQAPGSWAIHGTGHGWTTDVNGIEIRNDYEGEGSVGSSFAELDTTANSSIWQQIYVREGQDYLLSFDYSNRGKTRVGTNGLGWSFAGISGFAPIESRNRSNGNIWHTFDTTVRAGFTGWATLLFTAEGVSDSYGSSLDHVSVSSLVPEPGTSALLLAGLGVLVVVGRRRQL